MHIFVELGSCQLDQDLLKQGLDIIKHSLKLFYLFLPGGDIVLNLNPPLLIIRGTSQNPLFVLILPGQGLILQPQRLIIIDQGINLLIKYINIGQQIIILFLPFNKSILYLFYVSKSSCLFYCVEGLINYFHVSLVIVD